MASARRSHHRNAADRLTIQYVPLGALQLDPNNPRQHSKGQVRQIAHSIRTFGFVMPVVTDDAGKVIAGHGRIAAARELGLRTAPTIQLSHLTPAQARALQIADNRLAENATWDDRLLAQSLKELSILDLDFDLEVTGFSMGEIDLAIQNLDGEMPEADPADTVPEIESVAVSAVGDLWALGDHRILCADAQDPESYKQLLGGTKANLVVSDPPYNVKVDGHVGGKGAIKHREFVMASGEMSATDFEDFLHVTMRNLKQVSGPGAILYVFMDWRHFPELVIAGRAASLSLINTCVWVKHQAGMGSYYRSQHEFVAVLKNGNARHTNNVQLGKFGRYRTNVWHYPGIQIERRGEEGNLHALHPTVKPIRLVADAILDASRRGERVLDAFLGSGTTLMACQRVGRRCYGMELDPRYVDAAIRRWQADTGEEARHVQSGQTFNVRQRKAAGRPLVQHARKRAAHE